MEQQQKDPRLGKEGQDKITKFRGIITGKADYLTGCTQLCLTPVLSEKGLIQPNEWFDEGRIAIIADGIHAEDVKGSENGGPNRDQPRN